MSQTTHKQGQLLYGYAPYENMNLDNQNFKGRQVKLKKTPREFQEHLKGTQTNTPCPQHKLVIGFNLNSFGLNSISIGRLCLLSGDRAVAERRDGIVTN